MSFYIKFVVKLIFFFHIFCGIHANMKPLKDSETKILNGSSAAGHRYLKHAVMIRAIHGSCGGAIITPNAILTAAHCVTEDGSKPSPSFRTHICAGSVLTDCTSPTAQIRWAENIFAHKEYIDEDFGHDIAILTFSKALAEDGNTVERISFPTATTPVGTVCTLVGWGDITCVDQNFRSPLEAQFMTVTIMSPKYCEQSRPNYMQKGEFCAVDTNKISLPCPGDSGSPLIWNGKLVGVAVLSADSPDPTVPSIFTDVLYYQEWINDIIKEANAVLKSDGAGVTAAGLCITFPPLLSMINFKLF